MSRSIESILGTLELAPAILEDFVKGIPQTALTVARRTGFWTIEQHVFHLADVQPMLYGRLCRFRDEEHPDFVPFIPGSGTPQPAETKVKSIFEAFELFRDLRAQTVDLARSLPQAVWSRSGTHPEYRSYTAAILLRHIMMHDHWHMYRIEELWLTNDEYLTELT